MAFQGRIKPKYIWRIPLIGAILVLIGFLTPLAYFKNPAGGIYMWMWGLNIFDLYGYGTEILWTQNPDILIPSIICSVGIFICILIMFGSVNIYKTSTVNGRPTGNALLGASIVTIICTIGWMVTLEVVWPGYPDFWDYMDPHFGVFGLFIGSGISIVGYVLSRQTDLQRKNISIPKKTYAGSHSSTIKNLFNFCPECGSKVLAESQKFCVSCGNNLRNL